MNESHPVPTAISPTILRLFDIKSNKLCFDANTTQNLSYQQHFTNIKMAITKAIRGVKNTALILGAGGALDLPLKTLGERFDSITLVDLSLKNTKKAIKDLPKDLQDKFHLEQADLTGVFTDLEIQVDELIKQNLPFEEFTSKVVDLLPTLKKMEFPYQSSHPSFVCSSLVCSQLSGGIHGYLEAVSQAHYSKPFTPLKKDSERYDSYFIQLQLDHIAELRHLAGDDGEVYFADHYSSKGIMHLNSSIEEVEHELWVTEFPGADKIKSFITDCFSVLTLFNWEWRLPIKSSLGYAVVTDVDGSTEVIDVNESEYRDYQVISLSLLPNKV